MGYRLISVSDEPQWSDRISAVAAQGEYGLEFFRTGSMAMKVILEHRPDMAVLDLKIADIPGLSWLKMLRQMDAGKNLPVIVANDNKPDDSVAEAFAWGADDYVLKSCDPPELLSRIRAVLRRHFEREEMLGAPMAVAGITLDPSRHQCHVRGKAVELRPREFELLEILMRKAGRVLSRVYLLETIWGMSRDANTRAVDVGISRLRRALGSRAAASIETIERFGYRFKEDVAR